MSSGWKAAVVLSLVLNVLLALLLLATVELGRQTDHTQDQTDLLIARHVAALQRER